MQPLGLNATIRLSDNYETINTTNQSVKKTYTHEKKLKINY